MFFERYFVVHKSEKWRNIMEPEDNNGQNRFSQIDPFLHKFRFWKLCCKMIFLDCRFFTPKQSFRYQTYVVSRQFFIAHP